ncbi:6-phosphogluconolactonase [Mesorhizobium sp. LHD-90]|uniref:6-phosphogluconolactonase n=1 Tax=Mesorhizobium sp. LHD-90 TaxID=3071414 RepID=UPI0027E03209|nr:6-phosphogluconolactonase [Mesorhizobium sp. LHD-90]MDQ6436677.1 6-phosphogluconolactonase [Mesorhizobium sp. LHD-90]
MAGLSATLREFPSPEVLAAALAAKVAAVLGEAIETRGRALLAVSGGTTPALFFRTLSEIDLDWAKVVVTLVDERFVPEDSPRSNAGLAKANLLTGKASAARFVGLYRDAPDVEEAAREADDVIDGLGLPLDAVVLGMGGDGHTASFFPDAATLPQLLATENQKLVMPVHAASGGEPRLTLTMPAIANASFIALHIEGEAKRKVLASVIAGEKLPIRAVLEAAHEPVEVFWAP